MSEGKEITIFLREKNDAFGEIGPFSGKTYSCSSRAETTCEIYAIGRKTLESILTNNGRMSAEFIKWVAEKLETSSSKIKDFIMFGSEGALASFLIRLSNSKGIPLPEGIFIEGPLSHYDMATHIGFTRETVTRILNDFRKNEIIEFRGKKLLIKNIAYLKNLLNCEKCGVQNCTF